MREIQSPACGFYMDLSVNNRRNGNQNPTDDCQCNTEYGNHKKAWLFFIFNKRPSALRAVGLTVFKQQGAFCTTFHKNSFLPAHKLLFTRILTRIFQSNNRFYDSISSFSLFNASRMPPISLISPSLTASSPSSMVPTSLTSIEVSSISSSRRFWLILE